MEISDFLTPDRVLLDLRGRDKPLLINEIARRFARHGLAPDAVEAALLARERLGSTGLGNGFALPHARIEGLSHYLGLFIRLAKPIAFDAIDGKPVGLLFVLLIPPETNAPHVAALAAISRRFRDPDTAVGLKKAKNVETDYEILTAR